MTKSIEEKEIELEELNYKMETLKLSEEKMKLIDSYKQKNYLMKKLKLENENKKIEKERLLEFIVESNKLDISASQINLLYEASKIELPEMVKKRLEDVEKFHKVVFLERKEVSEKKVELLESEIEYFEEKIKELEIETNNISEIISQNKIFKESLSMYDKVSKELQELNFKIGKISKLAEVIDLRKQKEKNLTEEFGSLNEIYKKYDLKLKEYQEFIYSIVKYIYGDNVKAYFDLSIRERHLKNRPFRLEVRLSGNGGEGIGEVEKNIIDLLIFKYNKELEILIQDSSCFSGGIDTRQISSLIKIASNISNETNKQYIVAINEYQINLNDPEIINLIDENTVLELSEEYKLLKFKFD